jgi:hypothetical protein
MDENERLREIVEPHGGANEKNGSRTTGISRKVGKMAELPRSNVLFVKLSLVL